MEKSDKKPEGKMEYPSQDSKTRSTIQIDSDLAQDLKVFAASNQTTMTEVAEKAIRKAIK